MRLVNFIIKVFSYIWAYLSKRGVPLNISISMFNVSNNVYVDNRISGCGHHLGGGHHQSAIWLPGHDSREGGSSDQVMVWTPDHDSHRGGGYVWMYSRS